VSARTSVESHSDKTFSHRRERALPFLLIAPTVATLVALSIYPLIYAIRVSFQSQQSEWTIANFARLLSDGFFLDALRLNFF